MVEAGPCGLGPGRGTRCGRLRPLPGNANCGRRAHSSRETGYILKFVYGFWVVITQEGYHIYLLSKQFDSEHTRREFAYTAPKDLFGNCHHAQAEERIHQSTKSFCNISMSHV